MAGDDLFDQNKQKQLGNEYKVKENVKERKKELEERIWGLEEGGATALGPGLVVGVGVAGQARGSKVILCTDGLANVGCGSLEDLESEEDIETARAFYEAIARFVKRTWWWWWCFLLL